MAIQNALILRTIWLASRHATLAAKGVRNDKIGLVQYFLCVFFGLPAQLKMNPLNVFRAFRGQGETPLAMKIILMVVGSLALGLVLAFADPDNTRLMPSFSEHFQQITGEASKNPYDKEGITHTIAAFNRDLARAYLELDAAVLATVSLDDSLRKNYVEEIAFLQKNGRALELATGDISLTKVAWLPNDMLSVNTVESARIRYLNAKDKTEIVSYPEARYAMNYTLDKAASGWKIVQVTTLNIGKLDE